MDFKRYFFLQLLSSGPVDVTAENDALGDQRLQVIFLFYFGFFLIFFNGKFFLYSADKKG